MLTCSSLSTEWQSDSMLRTVALFRLPAVEFVAVHYLKYLISFVKEGASKKQKKHSVNDKRQLTHM